MKTLIISSPWHSTILKVETKLILVPNLLFLAIFINGFCAGEQQPRDGLSESSSTRCSETSFSHTAPAYVTQRWHSEKVLCHKTLTARGPAPLVVKGNCATVFGRAVEKTFFKRPHQKHEQLPDHPDFCSENSENSLPLQNGPREKNPRKAIYWSCSPKNVVSGEGACCSTVGYSTAVPPWFLAPSFAFPPYTKLNHSLGFFPNFF